MIGCQCARRSRWLSNVTAYDGREANANAANSANGAAIKHTRLVDEPAPPSAVGAAESTTQQLQRIDSNLARVI